MKSSGAKFIRFLAKRRGYAQRVTAIIERDGEWFVAYCSEIPGANGQGRSKGECTENLAAAITPILEDRCTGALCGIPPDTPHEVVTIG